MKFRRELMKAEVSKIVFGYCGRTDYGAKGGPFYLTLCVRLLGLIETVSAASTLARLAAEYSSKLLSFFLLTSSGMTVSDSRPLVFD